MRERDYKTSTTVADFVEMGRERLGLEIAAGAAGIDRRVDEAAVNRPGLALTGFFRYFANKRVQTMGHAEMAYLSSLSREERRRRLDHMFRRHVPCVVVTRWHKILPELTSLGERYSTPVFR